MKTITYIAISIILFSCSNNSNETNDVKTIHFEKNNINLFDSLEFRFVQLETTPNSLVGGITHVEAFDNRIFIHDLYVSKSIFVFDSNGFFITQIGSKGGDSKSYITPFGFEIDKENRRIVVNDLDRRRLVFYDLDSYEYIMHKECPFSYTDLFISNNRFYFFSHYGFDESRKDNYILVTDTFFNPIFKDWKCNFKTYRNLTVSGKQIYSTNNEIFASHHLQPYIYKITENGCYIHTQLSFEGLSFPTIKSSIDPKSYQYMDELDKSENKIAAFGIYESNNILFIQLIIGKKPHFAIHNKTTKNSYLFEGIDFIKSTGLEALILPQGATEEEIICMIPNQKISNKNIQVPEFATMISKINDDDNPILCFMKWKNKND